MLLAQSPQIVLGYACSFANRFLNHTLQFKSAAQQRSAGAASFSILYLDRHIPSITFSDTSTNRFWAAVWPSAITWRSKVLRPPFWPLGQFFRCRLPPCLRRTLRTNTTTINYTHFNDASTNSFLEEFWPPHASFTASFVRYPGIYDFGTLDESLFAFSNLETDLSQSNSDFWNLEFPFNNTLGAEVELSDSLALFPQGLAIRPAVEELLEIASEAASQRDGASPISTISSFTPSPLPTSSPSPSIRCSWPTCEKVFKNRSDYKYVFPPETVRSDLIYSCFTAITADTTTYRSSVCPVLFVKPQRESLIGTSIQFTSSLRSTFARFLHAADP